MSKILERVRALMAKADGTNFPEEAEAFRAKADELMAKHAIEMWQVVEAQRGLNQSGLKAEVREFERVWASSPYREALYSLFWEVARHCRCRPVYEKSVRRMPVVGMPSDLDYLDLLYTSLALELTRRVDPKPLPELSEIENLVMLKEAGMSWPEIARRMIEAGLVDRDRDGDEVKTRNKMTRDYRAWCKRTGHPQSYRDHNVYRRSFAGGFVTGAEEAMRKQRREAEKANSTGMELVLTGSSKAADDAMEAIWPGLLAERRAASNKPVRYRRDTRKQDWAARGAGEKAGREAGIIVHQNQRMANRKQIGE
jgi:hypothetical protein